MGRGNQRGRPSSKEEVAARIAWTRERRISQERARELYDTINSFVRGEGEELLRWGMETPEFASDCWEWGSYDYPADAKEFVQLLYPAFVKMLQEEAAREVQGAAQTA